MSFYVVDVESDGPLPGPNSMVCFGAVKVDAELNTTFYGKVKPISDKWIPDALAISGFSREQHLKFDDPAIVMPNFADWVNKTNTKGRPIFITDNPAFDFAYMNYYFHTYVGSNPFGFSARRIGDLFCGMQRDVRAGWKHLRKTVHDHHPVNDAKGNAEAIWALKRMGLKIDLT